MPALGYIARRLAASVVALLLLSMVVFGISRLAGNPVALMLPPQATRADFTRLSAALGLNESIPLQYFHFLENALHGNLGESITQHQSALTLVLDRVSATAELAAAGMFLAVVIGIPLGVLAAVKRNSIADRFSIIVAVLGTSIPNFWLGMMLILVFSVDLHLVPASGRGTLSQLILPAITLATYPMARIARLTRSGLVEVLGQDYVRTARAKGVREGTVIWVHSFPNAAISILTIIGLQVGALLGGAVIVETVFAWPGLGQLVVQAVLNSDYPIVQAATLFIGVVFIGVNFLVDLSYVLFDPRIRLAT